MSKERLSKLQKWILKKCYEEGEYIGKYNDKLSEYSRCYPKVDYYIIRRELITKRINEYYEEHKEQVKIPFEIREDSIFGGSYKHYDREKEKRIKFLIRRKLEVSTSNSIKSLRDKKYIASWPAEYTPESWRYEGIWLSEKGIKTVKELIINNLW